ncbi:MAG: BatD family protein [Bacteroidaceae bacterium]|nr:BatD family protein [Bacteroidaceae bacterium]
MKKRLLIVLTYFCCLLPIRAQVSVEASIDSLELLIGEQAHITLQVSLDAEKRLLMPTFPDTLVRGVEVLEVSKPDTQYINDNKRMLIKEVYTITSFDSALYYLPPMEVKVEDEVYKSNPLALKVFTMQVDTLHPDQFFGTKDVMKPEFMWSDWYGIIACIVLWAPAVFLLLYLIKRFRDNQPIIRKVKVEPKLPPHQEAMQEIERIRDEKVWQHGLQKEYYTQLTDTLRSYIERRFGFKALEMTSEEIIDRLKSSPDAEAMSELRSLLSTADLVKFAKFIPMMNENDTNLMNAVKFINETREAEDPNAKPEPTEITIVEKRPLRTKIILGVGIALISIFLIGSLVYVGLELYNNLS